MTTLKAKLPIFTKGLPHSIGIGMMGFIVVAGPLLWATMDSYMSNDHNINPHTVPLALGCITMRYVTLVRVSKEALLCGMALGVTTAITWAESALDGLKLGLAINCFGILSAVGSLALMFIYAGLVQENLDPNIYNSNAAAFLTACFNILFILTIFYFLTISLLRRKKDLGDLNG